MSEIKNIVNEDDRNAYFEKAEKDQLRTGLNRSLKERFLMTTTLYKVRHTLKGVKIAHKSFKATTNETLFDKQKTELA